MITNQSERKKNIDLISNNSTVTNSEALKVSLSEQLKNVKRQKQEEFYQFKSKQAIDNNINESLSKQKHQGLYPSGTTVIVGDSIINGVIEERINKKNRPVKVRNFPGATVPDMEYLFPIIQKKPSNIILHVGTNDAKNVPSRTVLDNLLKLKAFVRDSLPTCRVFISTPTLRTDDGKAQITVRQLTKHLLQLKIDTINNNNINVRHLGGKGLHLNQSGSNLLSKNFVNAIQKLGKTKGCSDISNNSFVESEHPFRPESASLSRRSNTSLTAGFLENLRGKNKNRPIIAQLNINSLRNKFGFLSSHITKYVDILLLSETKLDDSFPTAQFLLNGFCKPYRLDRISNGGGILLHVRDDIPSRLLTDYKIKDNLELFFVEVNIRKKKWLLGCSYNSHKNNISNHLHHLSKGLDVYLKSFDNILIMGDLNSEVSENCLNGFCNVNSLKTLNRGPNYFKNPNNPLS